MNYCELSILLGTYIYLRVCCTKVDVFIALIFDLLMYIIYT